jgi:hypothetical protein
MISGALIALEVALPLLTVTSEWGFWIAHQRDLFERRSY